MLRRRTSAPRRHSRRPVIAVWSLAAVSALLAGCSSSGSSPSAAGVSTSGLLASHGKSASASPQSSARSSESPSPMSSNPQLQSCDGRLGTPKPGPPKDLPRPAGARFTHRSAQDGIWIGYLSGDQTVPPAESWRQKFQQAGYRVGAVETRATASHFTFSGPYSGTAYLAVLCTDHLAVEYQFAKSSKLGPKPAPTVTIPPTHKTRKHGGR